MIKPDGVPKRSVGTKPAKRRNSYAAEACMVCRKKCDGVKPICEPCSTSGRQDECSWGSGGTFRKQRTEAHFEAMSKRSKVLQEYILILESMLDKCMQDHGGVSHNGYSYAELRPKDMDELSFNDDPGLEYEDTFDTNESSSTTNELCIPTQNLTLEEGKRLVFHGNTAIFRFAADGANKHKSYLSRFPAIIENSEASYVLLVDGADESHYNPNFDWSRHLPSAVPIERKEHDRILDLLFKFFTSWCFRIVPALFLRDMYRALSVPHSQQPPKTPHYSPMLHNALVALAAAFSDDPRIRDLKSRHYFGNAAKSYIEAECHQPDLSLVHALSILASFHSSQGEQMLGYMYFGMSARISQALGLGIDCAAWVRSGLISEDDRFDRNWAYWTTFCQDVCWSLYVGRDFCVPLPPSSRDIPVPFVDSDFDQLPWHYAPANTPPQPSYITRTFAAGCELLMIARRIMDVVNGLSGTNNQHIINDDLISAIDLKLNDWKDSLSHEVDITPSCKATATPHRLMTHLGYWWLFILLHRPFYHRKPKHILSSEREIDHVKLCKRSADNIMSLLETWRTLYTLRYVSITLVQTVFSAGTIYLLMAVQAKSGTRIAEKELKHGLDQTKLCVQYLHEIGKSWQCATNIANILNRLIQQWLQPQSQLDRRSIKPPLLRELGDHPEEDNDDAQLGVPAVGRSRQKRTGPLSGRIQKSLSPQTRRSRPSSSTRRSEPGSANRSRAPSVDPGSSRNHFGPYPPPLANTASTTTTHRPPLISPFTPIYGQTSSATSPSTDSSTNSTNSSSSSIGFNLSSFVLQNPMPIGAIVPPPIPRANFGYGNQSGVQESGRSGNGSSNLNQDIPGLPAMLGGQTLPTAPYIPQFSTNDTDGMDPGSIFTNLNTDSVMATDTNANTISDMNQNQGLSGNLEFNGYENGFVDLIDQMTIMQNLDLQGKSNIDLDLFGETNFYPSGSNSDAPVISPTNNENMELDYATLMHVWNKHFAT